MPDTLRPTDPPVSYNFMVALAPSTTNSSSKVTISTLDFDAAFTQISGLGVQLNVNQVRSGGYNNQVYHLPAGVNRGALTLKRGLALLTSPLMKWCLETASGSKFIVPKTIVIQLMDKNPNNPIEIVQGHFLSGQVEKKASAKILHIIYNVIHIF